MATENEVKITRPIHGEAGQFSVDVRADGEVVLGGFTEEQIGHEFCVTLSSAQFATLGALVARVRKAQGNGKKSAGEKSTAPRRKRRTKAEMEAARATENAGAVANGAMNGAAPAAGVDEPVL